jgi:hypothetical protein
MHGFVLGAERGEKAEGEKEKAEAMEHEEESTRNERIVNSWCAGLNRKT